MIKKFYGKYLLNYPKTFLILLFSVILLISSFAHKLEVDASAETLLLENDEDLKFFRDVTNRFPSDLEMLIVSFAPKGELLESESISSIKKIEEELKSIDGIESVLSILDVPLLENSDNGIKDIINNIITLRSENVNLTKAKKEFLTSPIYNQNLVSQDFKTTAIIAMVKPDPHYFTLLEKRNSLRDVAKNATSNASLEFKLASAQFKEYRDNLRIKEHKLIFDVREVLKSNEDRGALFLGGVSMIAVDMITFVKKDIMQFGLALFSLLTIVLWIIFKQLRFVVVTLFICILSILTTAGALGFFGWEVTVISSNFVALQLILTISIVLHLVVTYREETREHPDLCVKEALLATMLKKASPTFFAVFTTIIGFQSLILSNIRPIINLGWMMSSGILLSFIISMIAFPAIMVLLPKKSVNSSFEKSFPLAPFCAKIVDTKGWWIIGASIVIVILTILGVNKLKVENSFINYFKSSTEIYKGMKNIDKNLGGTTPLDVIVTLGQKGDEMASIKSEDSDGFDEFESEFEETKNEAQYWFTPSKMQMVMQIHDYFESLEYIGKVQSLGTMLKTGERLNDDKPLDSFALALLYNNLPQYYKDMLLSPYVNIEHNELRFTMRIVDSNPELQRNVLLNKIQNDLKDIITPNVGEYRLTGAMVLYNNMLQSLFSSQILTLGTVVIIFFFIFWPIFRSVKTSLIAIVSTLVPIGIIFAFMGFMGIALDMMTITIAAISIGMGVDGAIHYILRFKEELNVDNDYKAAMYRTHNSIGFAMYYTTLSTVLGFSVLVFSNFVPTIYFGLLTVVVMLMVFFGSILLLPELLIMLKPFKKR